MLDQDNNFYLISLSILITCLLDKVWILLGEVPCLSLMGVFTRPEQFACFYFYNNNNNNCNNECLYCSLDKNTYLMLQDKKFQGSAKNYNRIQRKKKDQTRYNLSGIKYHKRFAFKN